MSVVNNDADKDNICQQATGGEKTDREDACTSITDDKERSESRPDHAEGALEAKRRRIYIPEVKINDCQNMFP